MSRYSIRLKGAAISPESFLAQLSDMVVDMDTELLIRDKYAGDTSADLTDDLRRLVEGEPLAYVIGWVPFLGLKIYLDTHPLIPRSETEWWTEELVAHLKETYGDAPFSLLDLCAGSGAIGLVVLATFPNAHVAFGELVPEHAELIKKNLKENGLDVSRARIQTGSLFEPFADERFDVIATNPPYIPEERVLPPEVSRYEPSEALYAGSDGLSLIRQIALGAREHLKEASEIWIECDIENAEETKNLLMTHGAAAASIRKDLYGRPRLSVGYYL